jgi:short-subunit dehydrogenase
MGKIIIIGANGAVGKACTANLAEKDLVLISRSEFDNSSENQPNSEKVVLDINNYEKTEGFINSIDYEISGIIFAVGSITLKPFSNTSIDDFKKLMDDNFYNIVNFLKLSINKMSNDSSVVFFFNNSSLQRPEKPYWHIFS